MNWHETIVSLQDDKEYKQLIHESYITSDLEKNIISYKNSDEFKEILMHIKSHFTNKKIKILDVGSGNGISCVSFALEGYNVIALEPDKSDLVGSGAIKKVAKLFSVDIEVSNHYFEDLPKKYFNQFDIVFARQAMHHANSLEQFTANAKNALKSNRLFSTIRDHVISNDYQKARFLKNHPLHSFYGGENAYTLEEYLKYLKENFNEIKIIKPSQSAINYSPWSISRLKKKLPIFKGINLFYKIIFNIILIRMNYQPGRLYSFINKK